MDCTARTHKLPHTAIRQQQHGLHCACVRTHNSIELWRDSPEFRSGSCPVVSRPPGDVKRTYLPPFSLLRLLGQGLAAATIYSQVHFISAHTSNRSVSSSEVCARSVF